MTGYMTAEIGEISADYHTFNELYEHRHALFIALCRVARRERHRPVWRARLHADGTMLDGWFILGMGRKPGEQITYHLPGRLWPETEFARTLDRAPEFDGHTPEDLLLRLRLQP